MGTMPITVWAIESGYVGIFLVVCILFIVACVICACKFEQNNNDPISDFFFWFKRKMFRNK